MPKMVVITRDGEERTVEAQAGLSVMEVIRDNGFEPADDGDRKAVLGALFRAETSAQSDGAAYADFLGRCKGVRKGKLGVVGYCFTGAMAVHTAAAAPDRIAAAASFHGGMLVTDTPESPHRQLPRITARLYFGHAVEDKSMTAAQIETLEQALRFELGR